MTIRKATHIAVPIVGSSELSAEQLVKVKSEYECLTKDLNEKLENGWKIFSTHTANNNSITYLVYVLTKSENENENEKYEEVEGW